MNKRSLRSFGIGILFSVSILGAAYFSTNEVQKDISIEEAKKRLKKENYLIYSEQEFESVKKEIVTKVEKEKIEATEQEKKEQNTGETSKPKTIITYHLEVTSGMTSNDIVDRLLNAKIIKDSEQFQKFLDDHGYSTKIQLGVFVLTSDMSLEQIANTITN
jgi:Ca2+-dependent lipid-binding protein